MAKERTSAAFKAFLGGVNAVADTQNRRSREDQAEKSRMQAERLAEAQRKAVALNLKTQIDAANKRQQEQLSQAERLHKEGLIHSAALNTENIQGQVARHNATLTAQKQAQIMSYNINQMKENMSYFEQYGVAPPAKWQFDNQGLMLPAGDPSYWNSSSGSSSTMNEMFNRNIGVPDPTEPMQIAAEAKAFPNSVVSKVNKLVADMQANKPYSNNSIPNMGGVQVPNASGMMGQVLAQKPGVTGEELVNKIEEHMPPALGRAIAILSNPKNLKKNVVDSSDLANAVSTLGATGTYFQAVSEAFANPDSEFSSDINKKVKLAVQKYLTDKTVEVGVLLNSYSAKRQGFGNKGSKEMVYK